MPGNNDARLAPCEKVREGCDIGVADTLHDADHGGVAAAAAIVAIGGHGFDQHVDALLRETRNLFATGISRQMA